MSLTNIAENKFLDHLVGKTAYTMPTLYVGYSKADPGEDGSGLDEPSGGGYARKVTAGADWNAASAGAIDNVNPITFATATGVQGDIPFFAFFDAISGGNLLASGPITTGESAWVAATVTALDDVVRPTAAENGFYYKCTTAGTTHASIEPTWPTTHGGTVGDGTVTWTCYAAKTISNGDTPNFPAGVLDITLD
ncbi:MAG: hypothetical protein V3T30_02565 [Thermodesulfobacteriota bacterium]